MPDEFAVLWTGPHVSVSEEPVHRNIRSKRLKALRRGTQWLIQRDVLLVFASSYDPRIGQIRQMP